MRNVKFESLTLFQKIFKFPFLKNEWHDDHFDISNAHHLAGKTLMWIARDCGTLDEKTRNSLTLVGAVLYDKYVVVFIAIFSCKFRNCAAGYGRYL